MHGWTTPALREHFTSRLGDVVARLEIERGHVAERVASMKVYFDALLAERERTIAMSMSQVDTRFASGTSELAALRAGFHDRFVGLENSVNARLALIGKSIDELRRLVYVGMGIAIAIEILLPLVRR